MEICPEARFTIAEGIKSGEILFGPPLRSLPCSRSMMSNPPMPDETYTPTSSRLDISGFQCACFTAKSAPARATWMKRPIFFSSFFSIHWKGSKFFTSPAILQSKCVVSKCVIGPTPLTPATRFFQLSSVPLPSAQTSPTPVTTTRRVTVFRLLTGSQGLYLQTLTRKRFQGLYLPAQAGLQTRSDRYLDAARNARAYLDLACLSMYSTASFTVVIFSASSSGTSMPNASSNAITNSTWSSESAPRSSTNDAVGVTSASSTPSCSTIICFTRSSTLAIPISSVPTGSGLFHRTFTPAHELPAPKLLQNARFSPTKATLPF